MHACLLDVLHDTANHHIGAIADAIDIHLNGIIQETVKQYGGFVGCLHRFAQIAAQLGFIVHDFHRAAAKYV